MNSDSTNSSPAEALVSVPVAVLKNTQRSSRIIAAYERLIREADAFGVDEGGTYEPSLEDVAGEAGVSKRDVGPVINTHKRLAALREDHDKLPEIFMMQILSSVNEHFDKLNDHYYEASKQQQTAFAEGIEEHGEEIETLESRLGESELNVAQKQAEINDLNNDVADLNSKLNQHESDFRTLEDNYKELAVEIRELKIKHDNLAADKQQMSIEHDRSMKKAENDFKDMRKELIDQHEQANAKLMEQLGNERGERRTERNKYEQKMAAKEDELKTLTNKHEDALLANVNLSKDCDTLLSEKIQLAGQLTEARNELRNMTELQSSLLISQQKVEQLQTENKQLQSSIPNERIQAQLEEMQEALRSIKDDTQST